MSEGTGTPALPSSAWASHTCHLQRRGALPELLRREVAPLSSSPGVQPSCGMIEVSFCWTPAGWDTQSGPEEVSCQEGASPPSCNWLFLIVFIGHLLCALVQCLGVGAPLGDKTDSI